MTLFLHSFIFLPPLSLLFGVALIKSHGFPPNVSPSTLQLVASPSPWWHTFIAHVLLFYSPPFALSYHPFPVLSGKAVLDPYASFPFSPFLSGLFWLNASVTMTTLTILKPPLPPLTSVPIYLSSVNQSSPPGIQMQAGSV